MIAEESVVTREPDPLGGSDYVERLTAEIEKDAREYIRQIDAMGGTLRAIESGFVQNEIQTAAYRYQKAVEEGRQVVVGVNKFQSEEAEQAKPFRVDPELERRQIERLREVRAARSAADVEAARGRLEQAARGTENLLPRILECCRAQSTVGEISDTLRAVFGEHREGF